MYGSLTLSVYTQEIQFLSVLRECSMLLEEHTETCFNNSELDMTIMKTNCLLLDHDVK